jgi:hypothetical protein
MEKVRKADVTPPSKFNRRVPEALDRIVLRALARDLPDRYPSARELADELSTFIAQYRFDPAEMQEFVRGLFRTDYQDECEQIELCRAASVDSAPEVLLETTEITISDETQPARTPEPPPKAVAVPSPPREVRVGLWSRLREKFGK